MLAVGRASAVIPVGRPQVSELEVGVRASVVGRSTVAAGKSKLAPGAGGHSKLYGILSVAEVQSDQGLGKPVDESMIRQVLSSEINKNGFEFYGRGQKPDILIIATYGRGDLKNPDGEHSADTSSHGPMSEKLYIRVTAWAAYPNGPKAEMLWETIMVVDDRDHRDLNAVAARMLKAGTPHFDQEVPGPEIEIIKSLPTGRVTIGGTEGVERKSN